MAPNLDALCRHISEHLIDLGEAMEVYKNHPQFDERKTLSASTYVAAFKHIWLELALENCATENPGFNISFQTCPNEGYETKDYKFHYDSLGRLFVFSKITELPRKGRIHTGKKFHRARYETTMMLNGEPVIFDVRLTGWKNHGRSRGRWKEDEYKGIRLMGIQRFLTRWARNRKLRPLRQYWQRTDLDYCVVIPKDVFEGQEDSETIRFARKIGTRIIPFYTGSLEFRKEVINNLRKHNLNMDEN